jgi:hypothetical protein
VRIAEETVRAKNPPRSEGRKVMNGEGGQVRAIMNPAPRDHTDML